MNYEVQTKDGQFVASGKDKDAVVAEARAKAPGEQLIGVITDDEGAEHGGFFIGDIPAGMPL